MVTSLPEPVWKNFPRRYLNQESVYGGYGDSAAVAMVHYLGKDDVTLAEFPVIGYRGIHIPKTKDPKEIYLESVKDVLKSPEGIEILKEIFKGPEGKEILAEANFDDVNPFICDMSREVPDELAESEIKDFIKSLRNEGVEEFNLLDVGLELNLPFEQINRILERLSNKD